MALALAGVTTFMVGKYLLRVDPVSAAAVNKQMVPMFVDPSWVKSGKPNFRAVESARSADGKTVVGQWACDGPTTFEWTFGLDETVHLLDGKVEIDYMGKKFTLHPGDTATFHAGTKATWHIPEKAHKVFVLQNPGYIVKAWRRLFPSTHPD